MNAQSAPAEAAPEPPQPAARALAAAWAYARRAPGTYLWLLALLGTTVVIRRMDPAFHDQFLRQRSTNLHQLSTDPVRVLIASAFWLDGGGWIVYFVVYNIFHVPAERWLGTWRWLTALTIAHVGATYISEGVLYWAIHQGRAPESAVNTLDVGVSYALAGIQGILFYRIGGPWRWVYLTGVLLWYGSALVHGRTFTDVGHFTATLLGLACYPLTRGRGERWDPIAWLRSRRRRSAHR
ncbi:rhomboid-like protein [Streptacidiphilus carbonis]|uniref:rhomboid-like protein n=1 Tax=Streptacidiphilus carbonis TaxID=105422 RepID=UPI00191C4DEA|nr:rhomboid-like protein [Streptacidiphilus carbonis]